MFEFPIIRNRPRSPYGRVVACALVLAAGVTSLACELVIGDGPGEANHHDTGAVGTSSGGGGAATGVGGVTRHGAGGEPAAGGFATLAGGTTSVVDLGRGARAGTGNGGAAGIGGSLGSGGGQMPDASEPDGVGGAGGAPTCTMPVAWYHDEDGDGYGAGDPFAFVCPAPSPGLADNNRDCDDQNRGVHPGIAAYFGAPYRRSSDGVYSFDYDCSGTEEPDPTLTLAPDSCGLLGLAVCSTESGYAKNSRSGTGINPWCGSREIIACLPSALPCMSTTEKNQTPFSCH